MTYEYSRYDLGTGRFVGRGSNSDQDNVTVKEGEGIIEGFYDPSVQMVSDGSVVNIPDAVITDEETDLAWQSLRSSRSELLKATDWTQVADAPVNSSDWAVYRQALRDLPENTPDPQNVVFPDPPKT